MGNRDRKGIDSQDLGNPLGIAHAPVSPDSEIRASSDEESIRRRRKRAGLSHEVQERHSTGLGDMNVDPDGAAGVDMGYGGEGTDVKSSK